MKLDTIINLPNNKRKSRLLFSFIMKRTLPQSENWKRAVAEYKKLEVLLKPDFSTFNYGGCSVFPEDNKAQQDF